MPLIQNYLMIKDRNSESLRKLSMVLRQLGKTFEEKTSLMEESIKISSEAVKMDVTDGESWCMYEV